MSGWPDGKLRTLRQDLADQFALGEPSGAPAAEALAAVREAVRRVHNERLADEALLAGLAMAEGQVVDPGGGMDGCLVSAIPAFLSVLRGHTVHGVSLDSARARQWSERLDGVLGALGLSSGCLMSPPDRVERKGAYGADIVYGDYEEFGYDYLRDNLAVVPGHFVQRPNRTAIVDDVGAVLLGCVGQRLMIMRAVAPDPEHYHKTAALAGTLIRGLHFELDDQTGEVLIDTGKVAGEAGRTDGVWTARREWELANAIRACMWYRLGIDFSIQQGGIVLIDRPGNRLWGVQGYTEGIRQALEAHAGVRVTPVQLPRARITVRDYFRTYVALSGMFPAAVASAGELAAAYGLQVADVRRNSDQGRSITPAWLRMRDGGAAASGIAGRVPSEGERISREDFERQLTWLKLEAEIEGERREHFYAERGELARDSDQRHYILGLLEGVIDTYLCRYPPNMLLQALFRLYETRLSVDDLPMRDAKENTGQNDTALRARLYRDIRMAYDAREQSLGPDIMRSLERRVIVPVLDEGWSLHLAELDAIFRLACQRAGPEFECIYRSRAQESHRALLDYIRENVAGYLFHLEDTT